MSVPGGAPRTHILLPFHLVQDERDDLEFPRHLADRAIFADVLQLSNLLQKFAVHATLGEAALRDDQVLLQLYLDTVASLLRYSTFYDRRAAAIPPLATIVHNIILLRPAERGEDRARPHS